MKSKLSVLADDFSMHSHNVVSLLNSANDMAVAPPVRRENSSSTAGNRNPLGLTPRELDVLRAVTEGMTNKDIAFEFGISLYTVKHHMSHIFDKTGVGNRLELGMFAIHHGWVAPNDRYQAS